MLDPAASIKFLVGPSRWPVEDGKLTVGIAIESGGETRTDSVSFSVPADFHSHPDGVAAALSTLAGRKYARISFDFPISREAQKFISATYEVDVTFDGVPMPPRTPGKSTALNFSGGFDSLAAKLLAGDGIQLISMAFGGAFVREETYFQTYDTIVVQSDLRAKGYHRNDWRFMGSGSLLLADYLDLGLICFGTIFEATPWNYRPPRKSLLPLNGPFGAAGTRHTSWVSGLTEFGTAMVLLTYQPDAILPALKSLAAPESEKYFRKQLLLNMAAERLHLKQSFAGDLVYPKERIAFGKAFGPDFLFPILLQRYGRDFVGKMVSDMPNEAATKEIISADLGFYFKLNPNHLSDIPASLRTTILRRAYDAGLEPFNEMDFASYRKVRALLEQYHDFPV